MNKNNYNNIEVLEGIQGIRKNLGMYIGNTQDGSAYHQALLEIISNSVDEFMAGHATKVSVILHEDGSAEVIDDGRGIPCSYNEKEKEYNIVLALTRIHAGGKFDKKNYNTSGGLHGVGSAATNAASLKLRATVWRDGKEYTIAFSKGKKIEDLTEKSLQEKSKTGTSIRFALDYSLFSGVLGFNSKWVRNKLKEISYLSKGLAIEFKNKNEETETFASANGTYDFVRDLTPDLLITDPIQLLISDKEVSADISFSWIQNGEGEIYRCFTNSIPNTDGGSHQIGFRSALTKSINSFISSSDLPKSLQVKLSGDDVRDGIIYVVAVKHPKPSYSSQTKDKLVSEDVRTVVEAFTNKGLIGFLEQNPTIAKKIINHCVNNHKAREAAKKAKEAVRKSVLGGDAIGVLPGKLADCSNKNPDECELFLCEGLSAGGTLKLARDRNTQAVLPLRGKVLNIEKSDYARLLKSEEISNIIITLGTGIGRQFNLEKLRYGKVALVMDSDVDGSHIRTLLLTFFFRQMPQLIENGNIYIAQPPLYKATYRGRKEYLLDDRALKKFIKDNNLVKEEGKYKGLSLQRYKGLGEINAEQLWETTLDPKVRVLRQIKIGDYLEADRIFGVLMGSQVEPRKDFIVSNSSLARVDV